jgi:hypothetical protein
MGEKMISRKHNSHIAYILTLSLVWLILSALSDVALSAWQPPIGIPAPSFGIDETHTMYTGQTYDFGAGPEPYKDAGNGPYTHYIDNTHPNATDSGNPYGTSGIPRITFPSLSTINPGAVVEIHGGPYNQGIIHLTIDGTQAKPIFIRGASINDRPLMYRAIYVRGHYIVVENIESDMSQLAWTEAAIVARPVTFNREVHHVSVRNCEAYGGFASLHAVSYYGGVLVEDVVFYNNNVHPDNMVAPDSSSEPDNIGIGILERTNRIWIVDNEIHHLGGDCIGSGHDANYTATNYYIGRNILHDTSENAIDLKEVDTVIISENVMYNFAGGSSGQYDGVALITHYGPNDSPKNVWILYNEIYNNNGSGIQVGGGQEYDVHIIGNIIHDIRNGIVAAYMFESYDENQSILPRLIKKGYVDAAGRVNPGFTGLDAEFRSWFPAGYNQFTYIEGVLNKALNSQETATAFRTWDCQGVYMMNNVFYNVDNGISWDPGAGQFYFYNNIISNVSNDGYHLYLERSINTAEIYNNIFYQSGEEVRIIWGGGGPTYNVSEFQLNTGKGTGCLEADPLFADATNNDFSLQASSPAIDTGIDHFIYQQFQISFGIDIRLDYDGDLRPQGLAWDIGAYEGSS